MTLNEMNEANGFELGAGLEGGSKESKVECGSPAVETGGDNANECVNMELSETDGFVLGADLEIGSKDSNVRCGSPVVESGGVEPNECVNMELSETDGFVIGADLESGIKVSNAKCGSPVVETASTFNANSVNDGRTEEKIKEDDQVQGQDANQLQSPQTVEENLSGSEQKGSQTSLARERRKSKYLSPPFIDLSKGAKALSSAAEAEAESSEKPGNKSIEAGKSSSLVKRGRKRQSRMTASLGQVPTTAPADLLMQLKVMALAPCFPIAAVYAASVFFTQFRAYYFSGISYPELTGEADTQDEQPFNGEENANTNASSGHDQKPKKTSVRKMKREKRMTGSATVNVSSSSPSPLAPVALPSTSATKPERKRKRKDTTVPAPPAPNQSAAIPDLNGNSGNNNNNNEPAKKKRMRKKKGTNDTTTTMPGITFANGETLKPVSLEVCVEIEPSLPEPSNTTTTTIPPAQVPHPNTTSTPPRPIQPAVTKTPEKPADAPISSTPEKPGAEPSVNQMRQSLEFMTSMLEKSGNLISPEIRANLEKEIQNLLKKLNPMAGPSSS